MKRGKFELSKSNDRQNSIIHASGADGTLFYYVYYNRVVSRESFATCHRDNCNLQGDEGERGGFLQSAERMNIAKIIIKGSGI